LLPSSHSISCARHIIPVSKDALFNIAIATIFAREFLEGAVIVGNYRAVIQRNDDWDEETKKRALKTVTWSAVVASVFGT
jgi:high-affinity Fe2+/Pb2+ permease